MKSYWYLSILNSCIELTFQKIVQILKHIIYNFRGTDILPKYLEKKRFMVYGAQAFGIPLIIMLGVVTFDRVQYKQTLEAEKHQNEDQATERYDPGFGEESCWFSSCSKSLSLFLYG